MKQQTAVEILIEKIKLKDKTLYWELSDELEQAKEIEKKQIQDARDNGVWEMSKCTFDSTYSFQTSEQYYNETYQQ